MSWDEWEQPAADAAARGSAWMQLNQTRTMAGGHTEGLRDHIGGAKGR
ncbi:hypothetical protein [Streptomyces sp. NPDC013455]